MLLAITFRNGNIDGLIEILQYLSRTRFGQTRYLQFRFRLDRCSRKRDLRMSSLSYLLMKKIRRDPRTKNRDLRSARYIGEIPRDNSEPRLVSSRSARVEKDGQNQGRFLMQGTRSLYERNSVPAIRALRNKGEKDTYDITC